MTVPGEQKDGILLVRETLESVIAEIDLTPSLVFTAELATVFIMDFDRKDIVSIIMVDIWVSSRVLWLLML